MLPAKFKTGNGPATRFLAHRQRPTSASAQNPSGKGQPGPLEPRGDGRINSGPATPGAASSGANRPNQAQRGGRKREDGAKRGPAQSRQDPDAKISGPPRGPIAPRKDLALVFDASISMHQQLPPQFRYPAPGDKDAPSKMKLIEMVASRAATEQEYEELFYRGIHDPLFMAMLLDTEEVVLSHKDIWRLAYLNMISGYCLTYKPLVHCPPLLRPRAERLLQQEYDSIRDPIDPGHPQAPDLRVVNYVMQYVAEIVADNYCITDEDAARARPSGKLKGYPEIEGGPGGPGSGGSRGTGLGRSEGPTAGATGRGAVGSGGLEAKITPKSRGSFGGLSGPGPRPGRAGKGPTARA